MTGQNLIKIGAIGAIISAVCCFTPILVIALSALGFAAMIGYLDIVLLPLLGIFIAMIFYGFWKRRYD